MAELQRPDEEASESSERPDDDDELWRRIEGYRFDEPEAELSFSMRLANENGWQYDFALRVLEEYRRFVYLCCISREELTPSDEVDQAWHLHLVYTRDYWLHFCENVLRRPLHHGPTEGGENEQKRFEANYERTLKLYETTFKQVPPPDIWPPAIVRFAQAPAMRRVNSNLFEIVPKTQEKPALSLRDLTEGSLIQKFIILLASSFFSYVFCFAPDALFSLLRNFD